MKIIFVGGYVYELNNSIQINTEKTRIRKKFEYEKKNRKIIIIRDYNKFIL